MSREMVNSGIPWIGEIPKEWKVVIGKNAYIANDGGVWGDDPNGINDTIVLRSTEQDIDGHLHIIEPARRLLSEKEIESAQLKEGDLIITKSSGSPSHIGKTSIIDKDVAKLNCCYSNFIQRLRVNGEPLFYWFLMNSPVVKKQFEYLSTTTTGINNINSQTLNNLIFPTPSFAEQKKIASFLDIKCAEIDETIALQEKIVEELKAYKQSVITEAVTKGLNSDVPMKDSGIEWIGEIPEHWSIDKIIRSFGLIGSGTTPKSTDEDNFIGNIRWIQSGDINGGVMIECKNSISENTLQTTSALKIYNPPFIIIAMYGASVGNTSISMIDGCVNQACCVLSESRLNLEYAFNVIKSCKDFWIRKAVGGGQPNISQDTIKSTWIPIPPKEEQYQIASHLNTKCSQIDSLINIKLSKIDSLKEYKKSIIYEYVTGKKEVI